MIKTHFWETRVRRPAPQAIIAYEIYKDKLNPNEQETVHALKELEKEGKLELYFFKELVWYKLKE